MNALSKRKWNWFRNENEDRNAPLRQAVTSWRGPISSISQFQREMEQVFNNAFHNFGLSALTTMPTLSNMPNLFGIRQAMFQPNINIASNDNEYTITVEAPGMEERDVRLDVLADGTLTITGEKRQEFEDKNKDYVECSYGSFQRMLSLPEDVDQDSIEANFKNGMLTITCPRAEFARSHHRQIPINGRTGSEGQRREGRDTESHRRESRENESSRSEARTGSAANLNPKKAA